MVAEGVEDEGALTALLRQSCDQGQGFYWTCAMPPAEFETWWADRQGTTALSAS